MENQVFVLDHKGRALMPCSPRKARLLLQGKKAKPVSKTPFTIQLLAPTHSYKQDLVVGFDSGQHHIGIAVVREKTVLYQAQVSLRQDVKDLIEKRKIYRRSRRNRKTRYRKPRFDNRVGSRRKVEVWLPPSVQAKVNHNLNWIKRIRNSLPNPRVIIELGKFDPHKLKDPSIEGVGYQLGELYGWENRKMYVFSRDGYTCQICKRKRDANRESLKLHAHHIIYRSLGGSDQVENLLTVCVDCHTAKNHLPGGKLYELKERAYQKPRLNLAAATQMNMIKSGIVRKYENDEDVSFTWGYVTNLHRRGLKLSKSHVNDAVAITGIREIKEQPSSYILFNQYRKKKRSLHEATPRKGRKVPNRSQKRNAKNTPFVERKKLGDRIYLGDKLSAQGKIGYVSGFASSGVYLRGSDGQLLSFPNSKGKAYPMVSLSQCELLHHTNGWQSFCLSAG